MSYFASLGYNVRYTHCFRMEDWVGRLVRVQAEFKIEGLEYLLPAGFFGIQSYLRNHVLEISGVCRRCHPRSMENMALRRLYLKIRYGADSSDSESD